jgi:hypothetical protein
MVLLMLYIYLYIPLSLFDLVQRFFAPLSRFRSCGH